jgi:hypothetical protein
MLWQHRTYTLHKRLQPDQLDSTETVIQLTKLLGCESQRAVRVKGLLAAPT